MTELTPRETTGNEPIPGTNQDGNTPLLQSIQTSQADTFSGMGPTV